MCKWNHTVQTFSPSNITPNLSCSLSDRLWQAMMLLILTEKVHTFWYFLQIFELKEKDSGLTPFFFHYKDILLIDFWITKYSYTKNNKITYSSKNFPNSLLLIETSSKWMFLSFIIFILQTFLLLSSTFIKRQLRSQIDKYKNINRYDDEVLAMN